MTGGWWSSLWGRLRGALAPRSSEDLGAPPPLPPAEDEPLDQPWDDFDGGLEAIPVGRAAVIEVYGDPRGAEVGGKTVVDRAWERASMVLAKDLPGYAKPIYVHRLVEPYLREALRRARAIAPEWKPKRIGCFSPRHQRHNSAMPLSLHTWGIAFDVDSPTNGGRYIKTPIEPWSDEWQDLWPEGTPRAVVEAFESVGFEWGGRWSSFVDPMHFQLSWTRNRAPRGVA